MGLIDERIIPAIKKNTGASVSPCEPLAGHTTYRVGGAAEYLVTARDSGEAEWIYRLAAGSGIPLTLLGAGSNVIAPDEGVEGITLKLMSESAGIAFPGAGRVVADAGLSLSALARLAAGKGLGGLQALAGIPGTVGGAIIMNAGTRDGDIASVLSKAEVLTGSGRRRVLQGRELSFGYRRSILQGSGWLVLRGEFRLRPGERERLAEEIEEIQRERWEKFPLDSPNAGSVFKRPPGDYAGRLIEAAGCKGLRVGNAVVSERHANFILNAGNATAADILALIAEVRRRVFSASGVYLELEQIVLPPKRGG